jgi:DNA-binding beta-propeller fold protein YncE
MRTGWLCWMMGMLMLALFAGCGSSSEVQGDGATGLVWPAPPDDPRIVYRKTFSSEDDFRGGFGDVLKALGGKSSGLRLQRPFDVCVNDSGAIYVTDLSSGVIVIDTVRREMRPFESDGPLKNPRGIACGNGKVFIGFPDLGQVGVYSTAGKQLAMIGRPGELPNPLDVVYDASRRHVIVVDNKLHLVVVFAESGDSLFSIGHRGEAEGEFNFPQSAAIDGQGNIYVVDAMNFRVQVFDAGGKFLRMFGKQGNIFATFARPKGIALDTFGNIYVLDAVHQNFQVFSQNADLLMYVGQFSAGNDGFQNPVSIAIDSNNRIFVADQLNQRVQMFQLLKVDQ